MDSANDLLEQQVNNINNLLGILQQETGAIASQNASSIEHIAKKKLSALDEITQQDKRIACALQGKSLSADILNKIATIKHILTKCHLHNEANGKALQRASLSIHKLKNLFEQSMGNKEMTYDDKGKAAGRNTLGTNIKA